MRRVTVKFDNKDETIFFFIAIIFASYIFGGLVDRLNLSMLPYVLSAGLLVYLFVRNTRRLRFQTEMLIFVVFGILLFVVSLARYFDKNLLVPIAGYISTYMNFLIWYLFFNGLPDEEKDKYKNRYLDIVTWFAVISSILAVYQYFIDASIGGFANSNIYSNPEDMASGTYVVRTTALMGSPQNYGIFVGSAFACTMFNEKYKTNYFLIILIGLGVAVSGSRSCSLCVIVSFAVRILDIIKTRKVNSWIIVLLLLLILSASIIIVRNSDNISFMKTIKRLLSTDIQAQFAIYENELSSKDYLKYIIGKGIGYKDWSTNSLVGATRYIEAFGEPYQSAESYFIQKFLQSGAFGVLVSVVLFARAFLNTLKYKQLYFTVPLICIYINTIFTPSFTGQPISYALWPMILIPLIFEIKEKREAYTR